MKDTSEIVNAFNVDPIYLKHDQQGQMPDYRVSYEIEGLNAIWPVQEKNLFNVIITLCSISSFFFFGEFKTSIGKFRSGEGSGHSSCGSCCVCTGPRRSGSRFAKT